MGKVNRHEEAVINAFFKSNRRERFLTCFANPKKRSKMLDKLNHAPPFIEKYVYKIKPSLQNSEDIAKMLRARGSADTVYILSDSVGLDQVELPLKEALDKVVGLCQGTIVSCVPGKLAYYEGEDLDERYILERK